MNYKWPQFLSWSIKAIIVLLIIYIFLDSKLMNSVSKEDNLFLNAMKNSKYTLEDYMLFRKIQEDMMDFLSHENVGISSKSMLLESTVISRLLNAYKSVGQTVMKKLKSNNFNVSYNGLKAKYFQHPKNLICEAIKNVKPIVYQRNKNPFFKAKNLDHLFPNEPFLEGARFKTCALVMNSGSIQGSKLGKFIDSHNFVVRFNHAPTKGYEEDVGTKTDLRIVNSLLLLRKKYNFTNPNNTFYTRTPTLVFDPSLYGHSTKEWYNNRNKTFFNNYFKRRVMSPESKMYLLNPKHLWDIWDWLSSKLEHPLLQGIPSSGFIGLFAVLGNCEKIRLFEFVPSQRETNKIHYFEEIYSENNIYKINHPLSAEKLMAFVMSNLNRHEIFMDGYLTIETNHCSSVI